MDKKTISQPLYKRRSLTACMENALQLMRSAWWRILKAGWIPATVYALGVAILTVSTAFSGANPVGCVIGLLVAVVGELAFFGLFYLWIGHYKNTGEFTPLDFRRNIKPALHQSLRFLAVHIPAGILIAILMIIGAYSLLSTFVPVAPKIPLWAGILDVVVLLYLCIPLTVFCIAYLVGGKSYHDAFIQGVTMGTRRWGVFFALGFMVMVLFYIVSVIIGLPLEIASIIEFMNLKSMADGNAYALPGFFPVVKFILTAVVTFVFAFVSLYPLLSLILLYTSYEIQQKERQNYEKEQNLAEKYENM